MTQDEQQSESERRRAPRLGLKAEVEVHGAEPWCGRFTTSNISASGAFVVTERPPPRGSVIRMSLALGEVGEVDEKLPLDDVEALVVHVRSEASEPSARGCGLMFLKLTHAESARLTDLVSESTTTR